jgi:glycosyltransferase involved in cell wall biosynthesis
LSNLVGELDVPQARLDIIGTGSKEYEAQLREMARSLRLEDKILFVGHVEHHLLLERYTQYDALLFTSRWAEPFSRVVIEAMARGLPVIATPCGGTAEVISDGENGLLVPPDEPMMLAEAIKRLIENPDLTQRLRCAALKTLREHHDQDRLIGRVERHLQAAISEAGSG